MRPSARTDGPPRRESARERGFTMIEMIVGLVLLAIVLGLVGMTIVRGLDASGSSTVSSVSSSAIARTTNAFTDDVANAFTPHRDASKTRDTAAFSAALQKNEPITSSDPADPIGMQLDIDEVLRATSTELWLRIDQKCVAWIAETEGTEFRIVRMSDPAGSCGAGQSRRVMLRTNTAVPDLDTEPFEYLLMCNASRCTGSGAPASSPCAPWRDADVATDQRRWVIAASLAVTGSGMQGGAIGAATTDTMTNIRSREIAGYRAGLAC